MCDFDGPHREKVGDPRARSRDGTGGSCVARRGRRPLATRLRRESCEAPRPKAAGDKTAGVVWSTEAEGRWGRDRGRNRVERRGPKADGDGTGGSRAESDERSESLEA